jgi:hypothetical protein
MSQRFVSVRKAQLLAGILVVDLGFLWLSLAYHDILIIFYSSGLWVESSLGIMLALARSVLLFLAYHFRFPAGVSMLIGLELVSGVLISITDVWIYLVTDCECVLQIDGAIVRLMVRSAVLAIVLRLLQSHHNPHK